MTWISPRTWVANTRLEDVTLNQHIRDNLLETGPAKASASGQLLVSAGLNQIAARSVASATTAASLTVTYTGFNALYREPQVTVTTGTRALVFFGSKIVRAGIGAMWHHVSPLSPGTQYHQYNLGPWAVYYAAERLISDPFRAMGFKLFTELTPGSNTFQSNYYNNGLTGSGTVSDRFIIVLAL